MKLPSNRFETLGGDRKGQFSIRINQQWRIRFERPDDQKKPFHIEITDYYSGTEENGTRSDPPGKFLADELAELGMSATALARTLGVRANRIYQILNGRRAQPLTQAQSRINRQGTLAELWMNLQKLYELRLAERQSGEEIKRTVTRWQPSPEVASNPVPPR